MSIDDTVENNEVSSPLEKTSLFLVAATVALGVVYLINACFPVVYKGIQTFCENASYIK